MINRYLDVLKIERLAKKASEKAIEKATAYLHKTARNSIKKAPKGKERKYDLKIFLGQREDGSYETVENAKKFLAKSKRSKEKIVLRNSRQDVRNPESKGKYIVKQSSAPGQAPLTHRVTKQRRPDQWLKKSIRMNPKKGVVFLNPISRDREHMHLPGVLEDGGRTTSHIKILEGYYAHKKYFKNGKVSVSYRPVYTHKKKIYRAKARPFLKPALHRASKKLIEILKNSIGK